MSITHTKTDLSKELKLLIACCQTEPSEEEIDFIKKSLLTMPRQEMPLGCNQQLLTTIALSHGILPLVYKTLLALNADTPDVKTQGRCKNLQPNGSSHSTQHIAPCTLLSELKPLYMSIVQKNMLMTSELIKIMHLLSENEIEALSFKGPVLSQMAYGDITLRQYVDLDILVKKEDIYKIDALLKDRGYQRVLKLTPVQEKVYIQNSQDLGFYHQKSGLHLEMHWSLLNEDYPIRLNLDSIWKNSQTVKINQHKIKTFPTEELLTYLCVHGSKHLWERIEWIKDIDLLIRREDIDWEKVVTQVADSGFETMVYLGLSLAMQLFKTPLPEHITAHISDMIILDTLSQFVFQNWQSHKNTFQQTHVKLKLFPGIKERAIYLHKILIKPSLNDYYFIDLPKPLYWIYYFVHPYLLIKKYLMK